MTAAPWTTLSRDARDLLRTERASLIEAIERNLPLEAPDYAATEDVRLLAARSRTRELNVRELIAATESAAADPDLSGPREFGRREFRHGTALVNLLHAHRASALAMWRKLDQAGRERGMDGDALSAVAEAVFAWVDRCSVAATEGYLAAQADAQDLKRLHTRRLIDVLGERPPADHGRIEAAAAAASWPLPRTVAAAVVAGPLGPKVAKSIPHGYLLSEGPEESVIIVPDPDGPGREQEVLRALGSAQLCAVGPPRALREAWSSLDQARRALQLAVRGVVPSEMPVRAGDDDVPLLLLQERVHAHRFEQCVLRPLDELRPKVRESLLETLAAWLRHQGRLKAAATELKVHAHTVAYRLERLHELFGDDLRHPEGRLRLELALRIRELLPAEPAPARSRMPPRSE